MSDSIIIGAAIVDIPLAPVSPEIFSVHSTPLQRIAMGLGGDAANEALVLARLRHAPALVSVVGDDAPGDFVRRTLARAGVDTSAVAVRPGLDTGINVVLVRPDGERGFITSQSGSLRRLALSDILPALDAPALAGARVACLASLFVSPELTLDDTAALFDALKARGLILCADTTRPKRGETLLEAGALLSRLDYFFPNLEEAAALTGRRPQRRGRRPAGLRGRARGAEAGGSGLPAGVPGRAPSHPRRARRAMRGHHRRGRHLRRGLHRRPARGPDLRRLRPLRLRRSVAVRGNRRRDGRRLDPFRCGSALIARFQNARSAFGWRPRCVYGVCDCLSRYLEIRSKRTRFATTLCFIYE